MTRYFLNYLDELEAEAVFVLREVYAQFQNPVARYRKRLIPIELLRSRAKMPRETSCRLQPCLMQLNLTR